MTHETEPGLDLWEQLPPANRIEAKVLDDEPVGVEPVEEIDIDVEAALSDEEGE